MFYQLNENLKSSEVYSPINRDELHIKALFRGFKASVLRSQLKETRVLAAMNRHRCRTSPTFKFSSCDHKTTSWIHGGCNKKGKEELKFEFFRGGFVLIQWLFINYIK